MSKLTDEQIERAAEAYQNKAHENFSNILAWKDCSIEDKVSLYTCMAAAAPFLQFPWDEPTEAEVSDAFRLTPPDFKLTQSERGTAIIWNFVRRRNAALLPKPVDPRREAVIGALRGNKSVLFSHDVMPLAEKILAALNEVKP